MSQATANRDAAITFVESFNLSRWDELRDLCGPGFRWTMAKAEGRLQSETLSAYADMAGFTAKDIDETIASMKLAHAGTAEGKFALHLLRTTAEDDRVVIELEARATNKANGRSYINPYLLLFTFSDGRISEFREYQDTLTAFDVWGLP